MAQVPAAVAAVKPNSPPIGSTHAVKGAAPGKSHSSISNSQKGNKKSFADVLDNIKTKGLKNSKKNLSRLPLVKSGQTKESSARAAFAKNRKLLNTVISPDTLNPEPANLSREQISRSESIETVGLPDPELAVLTDNHPIQIVQAEKKSKLSPAAKHTVSRKVTSGRTQKPAGLSNPSNLTSSSSRVEVIDNRNHSSDSSLKENTDNRKEQKTHRVISKGNPSHSPEPVRLNHNSVIAETDIDISPRGDGKTAQRSAAAQLSQKLDTQAGNDIVRQVKVILTQANAGEVRINLRPDNLGQVRIRIRMVDNRLTGRIFVESAAAREAFRNALDGLQTRLVESGFGAADLELAWDESPREFMQNGNQNGKKNNNLEEAIREFDQITPTTISDESADGRVNMVI
ncbi:MAG: flagellar hook-length control protein FliK [Spirochaetaceae bacterium]|nr:flagellar hook-length control protein FliK [Spirochaetaceae bacterium]